MPKTKLKTEKKHRPNSFFQNIDTFEKLLVSNPENWWMLRGQKNALKLFHQMAERVPAYKAFLKKNKIKHASVKNYGEFKNVPYIDKKNYLLRNSLEDLCWDGKLAEKQWFFSTTSGSTGSPFYFPRQHLQNWQYATIAELYLRNNFQIQNKSTLYIDAFAMGAWIGGVFTLQAMEILMNSEKYSLSIITPGNNTDQILQAVKSLGNKYHQIIIGGYPPFIKNLLDEGIKQDIDWSKYKIGFIFSAEAFSEKFRDYIIQIANLKDSYRSTLNHYGTADMGTMAHETPISIFIRKVAVNNKPLFKDLFSEVSKLPTLCQYIPELYFFETLSKELLCSADSGLPLVRYNLHDNGGIILLSKALDTYNRYAPIIKLNEKIAPYWNLPFVYVYERSDFTVSFYGANVYPENVRDALHDKKLTILTTGRFNMEVVRNKKHDPILLIRVELNRDTKLLSRTKKIVTEIILEHLLRVNSEYKDVYTENGSKTKPCVEIYTYGDKKYFNSNIKQKWTKK